MFVVKRSVFLCESLNSYNWIRKYSEVRVRFAPSPTGFLHLGGLRTALYNYLFAKHHNGTFILRIEDTDQTRLVGDAIEKLEYDLEWVGIAPDEGPSKGGPCGPYLQSKRISLYQEEVQKLLEKGRAYRCFCTETRLDLLRREALRLREIPRYDNRCRSLSAEEVNEKLSNNTKYCIRFKLTPMLEPYEDLVYGSLSRNIADIEGDPVILKSDGYPTYHFANVVDDHYMKITHVLRGCEWQASTPKHLLLYRAFGWDPPKYAHLPLLLNQNYTKLSKRQSDITVEHFRNQGYFPGALINFLVSCGGGFPKRDSSYVECRDLEELSKDFNLNYISLQSCCVNYDLLPLHSRAELRKLVKDEKTLSELAEKTKAMLKKAYADRPNFSPNLDDKHIKKILVWSTDRIEKLPDLLGLKLEFLWSQPSAENLHHFEPAYLDSLKLLISALETVPDFKRDTLIALLRKFADNHGLDFSIFMKFLRLVISGLKQGPPVAEIMEILQKDEVLTRLCKTGEKLDLSRNQSAVS